MEPIVNHLSSLEGITHTINFDSEPEEYILTEEEAASAIEHEIRREEGLLEWKFGKLAMLGESGNKIDYVSGKIDVVKVLEVANSNKHYQIWQKSQLEKRESDRIETERVVKETWNAKMFLRLIRWTSEVEYGKKLIENNDTLPLIKAICFFLSQDERFETELGMSLQRGLWIRGVAGLGKTHIIRCASKNELCPIDIFSMLEIAQTVKENGEFSLLTQANRKVYLDDVGSEEATVNHYGTKINWLKDFLETFYLRSSAYNKLIVSTNYNFDATEQKYGFRVRSRIKDMFNVIDVTGKDLRGL
jgi:DNA replication protein DnaC